MCAPGNFSRNRSSAGVDMTGSNSKVGARLQAAFDLNRANGVWSKGFTVGVGIVFGAGK